MPTAPLTAVSKRELRVAALARRDTLSLALRAEVASAIAGRGLPRSIAASSIVAGYSPIRSEIDPAPLLRGIMRFGARAALPVVVAREQPLVFRSWSPGAGLVQGAFGTLEPPAGAEEVVPDVVLVPLAAFDRAGHRIGYGAGYYDRTIAHLRHSKQVIAIGIAAAVQQVDHVPALPHDIRLDYIATEREIIAF